MSRSRRRLGVSVVERATLQLLQRYYPPDAWS